jgi:hypothetical protein
MTATTAGREAPKNERKGRDRRRAPRHRCLSECLVRLEGAGEPLDWPGMVYNISATGIGLALPFPALPGLVLVIEPRRRRSAGLRVRARVVRAGLQQYVWFHGCEFVTRLSPEELACWLRELGAVGHSED